MTSAARDVVASYDPTQQPGSAAMAQARGGRVEDRYALALFELAESAKTLSDIEGEVTELLSAIEASPMLRRVLKNPVLPRQQFENLLGALAAKSGAGSLLQNFVRLVARKRRQAELSAILSAFKAESSRRRGEIAADVRVAAPLSPEQAEALAAALGKKHGGRVTLNVTVDPELLGGLTVKIGSRLYDRSLKSQLNRLQLKLEDAA